MLVKLEAKSNRVKGLAFHPKRPWILSSLHNGSIQLWDYRMGTLLDRFDEHDGPVRGIDFHPMQPLFVSGGDDYKIKVWNYKMRRCLFTLLGHLDYIRTVQFHNEQPWIVSSSDDQTIRVWNWQSRSCIAVLTGHNHYVMSASFHPREDLVVSASLDQTVRVWDISGLKKKNVTSDDLLRVSQLNQDLFGGSDVMAKYVLEGHDRGVNWASFHPTQPLIVSGADDRQVKIWRMNDIRAWEVDTLRGHTNNVSCVKFHSTQDLIISNSEDKSIRVWDLNKRTLIHSFRRENDRFWVLSVHPEQNLIAAGHDTGFIIFKLERERPASVAIRDNLLYVKDKYLRRYQFSSSTDTPVVAIRRAGNTPPRTVSFNPQEGYALITTDGEGGIWELYQIPKSGTTSADIKKGAGIAAVFVGRNKFVFMDKSRAVFVRTLHEDATKRVTLPVTGVDYLFQAYPSGRMLLRTEDKVYLYDFEQKTVIGEVNAAGVKYVVWSEDNSRVALLSKHVITLTNSKLEQMCSVHESIRVKSGAFDENGVFIYTTLNHMKYCLPNGDNGTIKTLEKPLYIAKVTKNAVHILDRDGKVSINYVDATEYKFKLALLQRKYGEIKAIISKSDILGQSIIAYLQQKGYPEIAMRFVKDDSTLFNLALESGNVDVAHEAASKLENKECWLKLGAEALRQGNLPIVEKSYYKVKDFDRLSFLYLITGNSERLQKMLDNAVARKDVMSRFNNALYLGDVDHRIKVLEEVGQLGLAYVTAVTHGLTEKAEALKAKLGDNVPEVSLENTKLLTPPTPVYRELSWPLLNVSKNVGILGLLDESPSSTAASAAAAAAAADSEDVGGWVGDDIIPTEVAPGLPSEFTQGLEKQTPTETEDEVGAWSMLDDIPELADVVPTVTAATSEAFFVPTKGRSIAEQWCDASGLAADHIAAGSFQTAMQILHRTAGIVNFAPLKPFFMSLYNGSQGTSAVTPMLSPMKIPLQRTLKETNTKALPSLATCSSLSNLVERLKLAYKALTNAKFTESQQHFQYIIHALLFVVVEDRNAVAEVKELLGICREYLTGLRLEFVKKDTKDPVRATELAAYFTHTNIQAIHQMLSLGSAMAAAYRLKNLNTAASFARRLLELNPNPKMAAQAQTILQLQEKNPTDEHKLNYDERNPFVVDGISLTPIYRGSELVRCAYCYAPYSPQHKGKLCVICNVAQIGADSVGLVSSLAQLK